MLKTTISGVVLVNTISVISIIPTYSNKMVENTLANHCSNFFFKKNENKLVVS